jgi:hypothetical protein
MLGPDLATQLMTSSAFERSMSAAVSSSPAVSAPHATSKNPSSSGSAAKQIDASKAAPSAEEKFLAYAKMTPGEKLRAALLSQLGLTEEQVKAMSPEEQQKVEEKIRDLIKQAAEKQMDKTGQGGFVTDIEV